MDWISLAMLSPLALGAALFLLRWARDGDRLPESLPTPILFGLVSSLGLCALIFADAGWNLTVAPLRAQQEVLGSAVADPLSLVEMRQTLIRPTSAATYTSWTYRLSPAQVAGLRRRCSDPFVTGDCLLGRSEARGWSTSASLAEDKLVILSGPAAT